MTRAQAIKKAREQAPHLAVILDSLPDQAAAQLAWIEVGNIADDERLGAKEASAVLGVQGPNLYTTMNGSSYTLSDGSTLTVVGVEAAEDLAMGKTYRARDVRRLAQDRERAAAKRAADAGRGGKRKKRPAAAPA